MFWKSVRTRSSLTDHGVAVENERKNEREREIDKKCHLLRSGISMLLLFIVYSVYTVHKGSSPVDELALFLVCENICLAYFWIRLETNHCEENQMWYLMRIYLCVIDGPYFVVDSSNIFVAIDRLEYVYAMLPSTHHLLSKWITIISLGSTFNGIKFSNVKTHSCKRCGEKRLQCWLFSIRNACYIVIARGYNAIFYPPSCWVCVCT